MTLEMILLTFVILLSMVSSETSAQQQISENDNKDDKDNILCIIGNDSGQFYSHVPGQIVTLDPPVCGFSSCACDPNQENQLLCSFCYDVKLDDCLLNGQSKTYPDENLYCSCASDSIDFSCTELSPPNKSPTQSPNLEIPAETPCVFQDAFGNDVVMELTNVEGPCFGTKFPYICNIERNLLLYPYCQHKTNTGATICAKNGEYVVFSNEQGDNVRCDCSIDSNSFAASSNCYPQPDRTSAPTPVVPIAPQSSDATGNTLTRQGSVIRNLLVVILTLALAGVCWT